MTAAHERALAVRRRPGSLVLWRVDEGRPESLYWAWMRSARFPRIGPREEQ